MTCHLCEGFCQGSKEARKLVSVFEDEDYEIEQAIVRSGELPTSKVATELRMFFLIGLGHRLLTRQYEEAAHICDISILTDAPWIRIRPEMSTRFLTDYIQTLQDAEEMFTLIEFEVKIRSRGPQVDSNIGMISSRMMTAPLLTGLGNYRGLVSRLMLSLTRNYKSEAQTVIEHSFGKQAVLMLKSLGLMPQDYHTVLQYLHTITESETIDPWQTKLPFLA
jgi:hypothetical protein